DRVEVRRIFGPIAKCRARRQVLPRLPLPALYLRRVSLVRRWKYTNCLLGKDAGECPLWRALDAAGLIQLALVRHCCRVRPDELSLRSASRLTVARRRVGHNTT